MNKKPYQQPPIGVNLLGLQDSDESDLEDNEKLISDLISESDRPIFAALKAATRGDLSAQSFLMDTYTRGELSPTMREMMEGMIEDGLKKTNSRPIQDPPTHLHHPPLPPTPNRTPVAHVCSECEWGGDGPVGRDVRIFRGVARVLGI